MLLQTPLKFWQMCKNFPAKISGTPQFFIRHVNNAGGRWNCLWTLTWRLTGRQGRCDAIFSVNFTPNSKHCLISPSAPVRTLCAGVLPPVGA